MTTAPTRRTLSVTMAAAFATGVLLTGCADVSPTKQAVAGVAQDKTELEAVVEECPGAVGTTNHLVTGDGGRTLIVDHQGTEDVAGVSPDQVVCVLAELEVPDSVVARMGNTRALDGEQQAEWDGYAMTWSYHPDSGVDIVIRED